MNNYRILNENEMKETIGGEPISVATVMAVLCSAVLAVIVYRLFMSKKGTATVPGGWKFTWN